MADWSNSLPTFDELYSVSDLHMGGLEKRSQIFDSGTELEKLINHLRAKLGQIALVINGDMVDFLAEPNATGFDPKGAPAKLERIARDDAFSPVWKALGRFVRTKGKRLVITLGNHDLELGLPWVRSALVDLIAADDDAARGRIQLAFDGSGFRCQVGSSTVLCMHGNEVDDWNLADYETIRRAGRDIQQGRSVESWMPNAGTHLVIEVMNDIKKGYPFVDLLKPELEAVIPVLLALAPDMHQKILGAFLVLKRLAADKVRHSFGFLSGDVEAQAVRIDRSPAPRQTRLRMNHDALMAAAEEQLTRGVDPLALVADELRAEKLGIAGAAWSWATGGDTRSTLRKALSDLQNDRSFEWSLEDDTFRQVDELVAPDVDFVLTGHTHLERALPRRRQRGYYLNTGTWVRLIQLRPQVLADQSEFNKVYGALAAGTMQALDKFPELILRRRTVAAIRKTSQGVRGELLRWNGGDDPLQPVNPQAGMTRA